MYDILSESRNTYQIFRDSFEECMSDGNRLLEQADRLDLIQRNASSAIFVMDQIPACVAEYRKDDQTVLFDVEEFNDLYSKYYELLEIAELAELLASYHRDPFYTKAVNFPKED